MCVCIYTNIYIYIHTYIYIYIYIYLYRPSRTWDLCICILLSPSKQQPGKLSQGLYLFPHPQELHKQLIHDREKLLDGAL